MAKKRKAMNKKEQRRSGRPPPQRGIAPTKRKPRKVDAKVAWKDLVAASAPERKADLESILRKCPLEVAVVPDAPRAQISARRGLIKFDHKTMRVYWLLGFASWRVIQCYTPAIVGSLLGGGSLQQCLDDDTELGELEYKFRTLTKDANSLLTAPASGRHRWPSDVPLPGIDREVLPLEERAAFDLTLISTGFAFLHELRHVMYRQEDVDLPDDEEELACDVWAREFLISGIGNYSRQHGVPYERVLRKRSMASAVGLFTLYETSCRWGDAGTSDYPPIADRMDAAIRGTPLPQNDWFWIHCSSIFLAILRSRQCQFQVAGATAKDYCHSMVNEIRRTS
jgi:hypothetical protein